MAKYINWISLSAEFLVVLIGILLAFQLNQCAQRSDHRDTINTHVEALKQETEFNKANLENVLGLVQRNGEDLDSLLIWLTQGKDFNKINATSMRLLNVGSAYSKSIAYKTMVETGDIRYIENFDFKTSTVDLYEYYNWVRNTDEIALESFDVQYFSYVKDNLDLLNYTVQDTSIYTNKSFVNALASYKYFIAMRKERYKGCMEAIDAYLELLDSDEAY